MIEHLTLETFKEKIFNLESNDFVYQGNIPAIIDFYAEWCGPCKTISPILEELQKEYGNKINIYKINTEDEIDLSNFFGIRSIPSLLFLPVGENKYMTQGAMGKTQLKKIITEVLKVE